MYAFLSLLCWIVANFPEIIGIVGFLAYFSIGRLIQVVGENATTGIIKMLFPVCVVISVILSIIMTVFVWRHYEETVSRGHLHFLPDPSWFVCCHQAGNVSQNKTKQTKISLKNRRWERR